MSDPEIILTVQTGDQQIIRHVSYLQWRHGVNPGSIVAYEISDMMRELRGRQAADRVLKTEAQGFESPAPETNADP